MNRRHTFNTEGLSRQKSNHTRNRYDENQFDCIQRKLPLSFVGLVLLDFFQNFVSREILKHN